MSAGGVELADYVLPKTYKVRALRARLQEEGHAGGRPRACQRLMAGARLMSDEESLAAFPSPIVVTFVLLSFDHTRDESLLEAAMMGDLATMEKALTGLADPNCMTDSGQVSLHLAAAHGRLDAVRLLCHMGADPAVAQRDGATPLFNAALGGHFAVVSYILNVAPETVNIARSRGATPLFVAAQQGHSDITQVICERHGDPNLTREDGATPLFIASQKGHCGPARSLCEHRADVNFQMGDGATALFVAAQNGHLDACRLLISHDADTDLAKDDGSTPLFIACQKCHIMVVPFLCEARADPTLTRTGDAGPIHIAAQKGNTFILRALVAAGVKVDAKMMNNTTPLVIAAQCGNLGAVQFLLNERASVDEGDSSGVTALFTAVQGRHTAVVKQLLAHGARQDIATNDGSRPQDIVHGSPEIAVLLARASLDSSMVVPDAPTLTRMGLAKFHASLSHRFRQAGQTLNTCSDQAMLSLRLPVYRTSTY